MKIAILGFGREGRAVLDFLKKSPKYDFSEIWILDRNLKLKIPGGLGLKRNLGRHYLKNLERFQLVFRSPGVPFQIPEIQGAIQQNTLFSSATKLFFEQFSGRIIGVTGTKGKGTTSTLLCEMLRNGGFDAHLAGNIGRPALEILPFLKQHSLAILELSSFQLQDLSISPALAVILDVFPDHLDSHVSLKEYLQAKANIVRYQTATNKKFFLRRNRLTALVAKPGLAKKFPVTVSNFNLFRKEELKIPGDHNFRNAVMAATVAANLSCAPEKIRETAINFIGLEHRLEFVSCSGQSSMEKKLIFYNDSASTNPQTTIAAIQSFTKPILLLAGGFDKNLDYQPLGKIIRKMTVSRVILFGANREKIKKALGKFPVSLCVNLSEAVKEAVEQAPPEAIILFSPGAASFDQFQDYADRGRQFKNLVQKL